jgi:hypothetical protein
MTRKQITTSHAVVACSVCGRTLLRGEHSEAFISGGSRRVVCELCIPRALHAGWIREGVDGGHTTRRSASRSRSLLGRLRQRRDESPGNGLGRAVESYDEAYEPHEASAVYAPEPAAVTAPEPEPIYDFPREPRSVRAVPTNTEMKMARALDVFNATEHRRTMAGITRSLGAPIVTVRPSATEGSVVSIVVAWEITWYRYEVDLGNEAAGVRLSSQGAELSELEPEDQVPNAASDEHGDLVLVAATAT